MLGQKLHFQISHESLDDETWFQNQIKGGNCFYDIVGEHLWTPRPKDQKELNLYVPTFNRIKELEFENANLKRKKACKCRKTLKERLTKKRKMNI